MRGEETKRHPSYGLVKFSRIQGHAHFFGADSRPDSYIELTVSECEHNQDLVQSWYFPRKELVSLRLTNNQFAELITSLNMGSGVPCTLEFIKGEGKIEQEKEKEYKVDFHKKKTKEMFTDILTNFKKKAQELDQVALKLPKKDQETVKRFTASIIQEFNSNMPFFMECFYEQMEKVAQEIKSNLEADVMHKLTTLGLETLQQKQLEEKL
jgi:hypothetical protein